MRLAVVIVIAVAALFAGGVFYFLLQYMAGVERDAQIRADQTIPGIEAVEVLVADKDLPAGTVIESTILDWQPWPDDSLGSGYVVFREEDDDADRSSLEEPLYDKIVRRTILEGEPITEDKLFSREGASFLAGMLTPGMRAVAIRVQDVSGVGGFIMPGDRVDVIVSLKWKIGAEARKIGAPFTEFTSETIVQNARVMGIDQTFDDFEENVAKAKTITIEVTPKQAEIIALAESKGELSLALRSLVPGPVGDIQGFTSDRETLYSMGGGFPATDRLAQPVVVAGSGGDGDDSTDVKPLPGIKIFRAITARRDLPRGTLLRESDIEWAQLSEDRRPEDHLIQGREAVTPAFLTGVLLNTDIKAGEPLILSELYTDNSAEYLGLALRPGMRAASLRDLGNIFAGTPGDRVDVVLTGEVEGRRFSETILQRARVLIADPGGSQSATIEVSSKQFETLAVAQTVGVIQLALRSANTKVADIYGGQFTSDLEISRAISGGIEALVASGSAGPSEQDMIVIAPTLRTNVLVAVRDLDAGSLLRDSNFRFDMIEGAVPEDAHYFIKENTNVVALRGALITQAIAAGEVLSADKLIKPGTQGFLTAALSPGMRGVSIAVDPVSGISGFISPGDRVDVLLTHELVIRELLDSGEKAAQQTRVYTETILRGIRVLAIEQTIDESSGKPVLGQTVTMEVDPKQAEKLALGARMGELSLVLQDTMVGAKVEPRGMSFTSEVDVSQALGALGIAREAAAAAEQLAAEQAAAVEAAAVEAAAAEAAAMEAAAAEAATVEAAATVEVEAAAAAAAATRPAPAPSPAAVEEVATSIKIYRSTTSTRQSFSQ